MSARTFIYRPTRFERWAIFMMLYIKQVCCYRMYVGRSISSQPLSWLCFSRGSAAVERLSHKQQVDGSIPSPASEQNTPADGGGNNIRRQGMGAPPTPFHLCDLSDWPPQAAIYSFKEK